LNEIYISLDIKQLIKGNLDISRVRLKDGFFRVEIYEDSVSNLERALGIRFGEDVTVDTVESVQERRIELEKFEMTNILVLYRDRARLDTARLVIHQLESQLNYFPGTIEAGVKLNMDIDYIKYLKYKLIDKDSIQFESAVYIDQEKEMVEIRPSRLLISGLELETWGQYSYMEDPHFNFVFRATNTGLDVLNFIFLGVLDLDEIEQIGGGSIYLDGSISGGFDQQMPIIRVNGSADGIGFRIKEIERDVTEISFRLFATSGGKQDLSEAGIELKDFTATFPEGKVRGDLQAVNIIAPEIDIDVKGELELTGLEHMIGLEKLCDLKGHLSLEADLAGTLDPESDTFLDKAGRVTVGTRGVGFVFGSDTVNELNGNLILEDHLLAAQGMGLKYNGNDFSIEAKVENLLQYLLNFQRDVSIDLRLASNRVVPSTILGDTAISAMLGDELKGLYLHAGASVGKKELDAFFDHGTLPLARITLDSFGVEIPAFTSISEVNASVTVTSDTLSVHALHGMIGESGFDLTGRMANFQTTKGLDTIDNVKVDFSLASDLIRAADLFHYKGEELIPEEYITEHLKDFNITGSLVMSTARDTTLSDSPVFTLDIEDLGWKFRYFPETFDHFQVKLKKEKNDLHIDKFMGKVGESDFNIRAFLGNFNDTLIRNMHGFMVLESECLDLNQMLHYQLPDSLKVEIPLDSADLNEAIRLDQIDYPNFAFELDVGEIRYETYKIFGLKGKLRSSTDRIFYMDQLVTSGESGGSIEINGAFNVANPDQYNLSAALELKEMNINDLSFEMQAGDQTYTLKENFAGRVSASGLAEVFFTPNLRPDMSITTAVFHVQLTDGELKNFKPLEAAGKYLDNKDLNNVRFSTLRNSFTLMDSKITIPLMIVESTIGQILIEGEQGLDDTYLYLLYVPTWLVKDAAKSRLSNTGDDEQEDEIRKMKMGTFMMLTPWCNGTESGVRLGDKREKYR
jgi:hypothetical protein